MRVMIDTNILFSALLFPKSVPAKALLHLAQNRSCVLCDYVIDEFRRITFAKRPDLLGDADALIAELSAEIVIAPREPSKLISDPKDAPILNAAILYETDAILSGDKHFKNLALEYPRVMTATEYLEFEQSETSSF